MNITEALEKLDSYQAQIVHGSTTFAEIAAAVRGLQAKLDTTCEILMSEQINTRNLNDWVRGVNENPTLSGQHYDTKQWVQARLGKLQAAVDAVWATWTQGAELNASVEMVRPLVTRETPECSWCKTPMSPALDERGGTYHYCRNSDQHGESISHSLENSPDQPPGISGSAASGVQ